MACCCAENKEEMLVSAFRSNDEVLAISSKDVVEPLEKALSTTPNTDLFPIESDPDPKDLSQTPNTNFHPIESDPEPKATRAADSVQKELSGAVPAVEKDLGPVNFTANLTKPRTDAALGWHLDVLDKNVLYVCRVVPGNTPVGEYNNSVSPELRIQDGDFIRSINDVKTSPEMMELMRTLTSFKVSIARPELIKKRIEKVPHEMLGLDLKYGPGGNTLLVENVRVGLVSRQAPEIGKGCRILSVNGKTGTPQYLMNNIQKNDTIVLEVARPQAAEGV